MKFDSHLSGVLDAAVATVNTLTPGYARGRPYEPEHSVAAVASALGPAGWLDGVQEQEIPMLARYAARLHEVFEHRDAERMDEACELLNELLADTEATPVLARHDGEPWHLHFHAVDAPWAQSWAAPMATALALVLGTADADRVGVCRAPACDRVYLDTSRNGSKRFCSTACQNRVKAAAFRARR